eukprot:5424117-Pyramimonas_sp.AAC.1
MLQQALGTIQGMSDADLSWLGVNGAEEGKAMRGAIARMTPNHDMMRPMPEMLKNRNPGQIQGVMAMSAKLR